jgi:hypothetical protein
LLKNSLLFEKHLLLDHPAEYPWNGSKATVLTTINKAVAKQYDGYVTVPKIHIVLTSKNNWKRLIKRLENRIEKCCTILLESVCGVSPTGDYVKIQAGSLVMCVFEQPTMTQTKNGFVATVTIGLAAFGKAARHARQSLRKNS